LLSFSAFQSIRAYGIFLTHVEIGQAVGFEITGGILILAGAWWKLVRERSETMRQTYVENAGSRDAALDEYRALLDRLPEDSSKAKQDANMTLPF
jgi:hypothetical protein